MVAMATPNFNGSGFNEPEMDKPGIDELLAIKQEAARSVVNVDEPVIKLVIFALGERYFAFKGEWVREVVPGNHPLYFVPGMPASVEGVLNVRGTIESVIVLEPLLQLPEVKRGNKSSILLAKTPELHSGIRVDELIDIVDLPLAQLQTPPESLPETLKPYVSALLSFSGQAVILLDLEKVFADYQAGSG